MLLSSPVSNSDSLSPLQRPLLFRATHCTCISQRWSFRLYALPVAFVSYACAFPPPRDSRHFWVGRLPSSARSPTLECWRLPLHHSNRIPFTHPHATRVFTCPSATALHLPLPPRPSSPSHPAFNPHCYVARFLSEAFPYAAAPDFFGFA